MVVHIAESPHSRLFIYTKLFSLHSSITERPRFLCSTSADVEKPPGHSDTNSLRRANPKNLVFFFVADVFVVFFLADKVLPAACQF